MAMEERGAGERISAVRRRGGAPRRARRWLPAAREAQFRLAARAALTRYPFVRYWEVGNEPEQWRRQGNNPADYLRMLRPFYEEAKALNPKNQVAISTLTGWRYVGRLYDLAPD